MYKSINTLHGQYISRIDGDSVTTFPETPANTDYQTFRKDVAGGVELQDADGNVMTQAQVDDFLKTIPE